MNNETFTIVVSLVLGILTFIGTIYAVTIQNRHNRKEIASDINKETVRARLEQEKLEQDIETSLWRRVQGEIDRLNQELAEERIKRRDLEARLAKLINENAKLTGVVDSLTSDKNRLEGENMALRTRVQELERRMGTGPLDKKQ